VIFASRVAETADWITLWDKAMDHGPQGTTIIQSLFKEMTRPIFGPKPCPFCDETDETHYFDHMTRCHTPLRCPAEEVLETIYSTEKPDWVDNMKLIIPSEVT
jgi:NAD-dependent DNA ligase